MREADGTALGVIQDMCMPPREVVRALGPRGFRWAAAVSAERIQTLLCIAEDDAQADNAVTLSADRKDAFDLPVANVRHEYTEADTRRRDALVRTARRVLRRAGGLVGKERLIDSFSHAVGTARMARHARDRRAVSRMPRLGLPQPVRRRRQLHADVGGVNPSLTITANAFRVAAQIRQDFGALTLAPSGPTVGKLPV